MKPVVVVMRLILIVTVTYLVCATIYALPQKSRERTTKTPAAKNSNTNAHNAVPTPEREDAPERQTGSRGDNEATTKVDSDDDSNIVYQLVNQYPKTFALCFAAICLFLSGYLVLQVIKGRNKFGSSKTIGAIVNETKNKTPQITIEPPPAIPIVVQEIKKEEEAPQRIIVEDPPEATSATFDDGWLVVRTSVSGKLHIENTPQIPCQDSSVYRYFDNGWGIAAVCDGAGSKKYSHHGSKYVSEAAGEAFERAVKENGWQESKVLPTTEHWHEVSKAVHSKVLEGLIVYASDNKFELGLLGCTLIVVIHSPHGILTTHIGDGRAAFCNRENVWKAIIRPHKGEEANQTVFITTVDWSQPDLFIESNVIAEVPKAFVLMSDGCESHSFEVNLFDEAKDRYHDPNRPYPGFFQPLLVTLRNSYIQHVELKEIAEGWRRFIVGGNSKLKNESDDKTMVLGVVVDDD